MTSVDPPTAPASERAKGAESRAARNTAIRAVGELVGKLATLAMFAVLARVEGQDGVGVLVFAMAFAQIATVPIDLGLDRLLMRRVAERPDDHGRLFVPVLAIKGLLAIPIVPISIGLVIALGYDAQTVATVAVIMAGFLVDAVSRTVSYLLSGFERGGLVAMVVVVQRAAAAVLGLVALAVGFGVVGVAVGYTIGSVIGLVASLVLMHVALGRSHWRIRRSQLRGLARESLPFAAQDALTVALFKLDAVLLSLMATNAVVGLYGSAYRLLESTFFITVSLAGAFGALYTYLERDSAPTIGEAFGRSLKLALVLLLPIAVAFSTRSESICRLFFGEKFVDAADPLAILGPVVVLLGVATLMTSLAVSRGDPRVMVRLTGIVVVINVVLNLVLIPPLEATGSAIAMLVTEAVLVALTLRIDLDLVGSVRWKTVVPGPLAAAAAMAFVCYASPVPLGPALVLGTVVYVGLLYLVDRRLAPGDVQATMGMLRAARARS